MNMLTIAFCGLLSFAPFINEQVEEFEVVTVAVPGSARIEINLYNPQQTPIHVKELLVEFNQFEDFNYFGGTFLLNAAQFDRMQSENFKGMEMFWLGLREDFRVIEPGERLTLVLGNLTVAPGAETLLDRLSGKVHISQSSRAWGSVPFKIARVPADGDPARKGHEIRPFQQSFTTETEIEPNVEPQPVDCLSWSYSHECNRPCPGAQTCTNVGWQNFSVTVVDCKCQ